ncbi:hypothetical protein HDV00_004405 [Rhizophlyctis rosea]|nr:hypothetical protein HDV00_004405 [Rhizophlyctis rosea]
MPSYAASRTHNAAVKLAGKRFLVVGGTSGIGHATALKLAAMQASVTIAGRNATVGASIVDAMNALYTPPTPSLSHSFLPLDISLMRNTKTFAAQFRQSHTQLHGLVITAGIMTTAGRTETEEKIDRKLAIHYYGRARLILELLPLLEETAKAGEDVRVLTVLAAGKGGKVNYDDMDLKKGYSLKAAADTATTYNDLLVQVRVETRRPFKWEMMVILCIAFILITSIIVQTPQELSTLHPSISFIHAYPGVVDTPLVNSLSLPVRVLSKALMPLFSVSAENCAESMGFALTADNYKANGKGWLVDDKAEIVKERPEIHNEENRKRVFEHTKGLTDV